MICVGSRSRPPKVEVFLTIQAATRYQTALHMLLKATVPRPFETYEKQNKTKKKKKKKKTPSGKHVRVMNTPLHPTFI